MSWWLNIPWPRSLKPLQCVLGLRYAPDHFRKMWGGCAYVRRQMSCECCFFWNFFLTARECVCWCLWTNTLYIIRSRLLLLVIGKCRKVSGSNFPVGKQLRMSTPRPFIEYFWLTASTDHPLLWTILTFSFSFNWVELLHNLCPTETPLVHMYPWLEHLMWPNSMKVCPL